MAKNNLKIEEKSNGEASYLFQKWVEIISNADEILFNNPDVDFEEQTGEESINTNGYVFFSDDETVFFYNFRTEHPNFSFTKNKTDFDMEQNSFAGTSFFNMSLSENGKTVKEVSIIIEQEINFEDMFREFSNCAELNIPNDFAGYVKNFENKFCLLKERLEKEDKISLTEKLDSCLSDE